MNLRDRLKQWLLNLRPKPSPFPPNPIFPPIPPLPPPPSPVTPTNIDMDLFLAHNQERSLNGKPLLKWSDQLYQAAKGHSAYMASVNKMAHENIGDGNPWQRIQGTGYRYQTAGENIAAGYQSVELVMNGWMTDPPHRANILGDFAEAGCSMVVSANGTCYWTVDFATPLKGLIVGVGLDSLEGVETTTFYSEGSGKELSSILITIKDDED